MSGEHTHPDHEFIENNHDKLSKLWQNYICTDRSIWERVLAASESDDPVLLLGPTGTGKELIANFIATTGTWEKKPFEAINCALFPKDLLYSELFGHQKGAFTGALKDKAGVFERASGGTIFLDEIGDMPPEAQVGLLRVLETREVLRLGSESHAKKVNVRVIAATNADVSNPAVLRPDLLHRLKVLPITLSPLRDQQQDIPALLRHFLEPLGVRHIDFHFLSFCVVNAWEGNYRELRNFCAFAARRSQIGTVRLFPAVCEFYTGCEPIPWDVYLFFEKTCPVFCADGVRPEKPEDYMAFYLRSRAFSPNFVEYLSFLKYLLTLQQLPIHIPTSELFHRVDIPEKLAVFQWVFYGSMEHGVKVVYAPIYHISAFPRYDQKHDETVENIDDNGTESESSPDFLALELNFAHRDWQRGLDKPRKIGETPTTAADAQAQDYRLACAEFERQYFSNLLKLYPTASLSRLAKLTGLSDKTIKRKLEQYNPERLRSSSE